MGLFFFWELIEIYNKMNNTAKIRIGLLGGRGYGKTVFLTKLISLADTDKDGFIQFDAGSEALQIKNIMLENDGRLPATAIKEMSKYNFLLGKQSGEKWRIQFCDYAGELLEKIDVNAPDTAGDGELLANANGRGGKNKSTEDYSANQGNIPYIRKIKRWLKKCDAIIVLFPVNIDDKDKNNKKERIYPLSEVNIFRQNVGLLLNIMQKDPILSNRPVCLAINKWDLCTDKISLEGILSKEPFKLIKNQLSNICGKNFFCMEVSAFGKHLKMEPEKADPSGKPYNVAEMLLTLAEKAEYARVTSIRDAIKRLPRFVGWSRYPFLLLKNFTRGITTSRLRRLNELLWRKYGYIFVKNSAISLVVSLMLIAFAMISSAEMEYRSLQREVHKGFHARERIEEIEKTLNRPRFINLVFKGWCPLLSNLADLKKEFSEQKDKYNKNKCNFAHEFYTERENEIKNTALDPAIRQNRIDEVKEKVSATLGEITVDSQYVEQLRALRDEIEQLNRSTVENEDFDIAYQQWENIQDDHQKAAGAVALLKNYTTAKYPQRQEKIEYVTQKKAEIETHLYKKLLESLHREIYSDDYGKKTDNYLERIKRAEARINEIKAEMVRLPNSSRYIDYDFLVKAEENGISYLRKYGPFDVQVEELLAPGALREKDIIQRIEKFISENERSYLPGREEAFDRLKEKLFALYNQRFDLAYEELQRKVGEDSYIRQAKEFMDSYDARTYPGRIATLQKLEEELVNREAALANELTSLSVPAEAKWQDQVLVYQNKISEIDERIEYFLDGSKHIEAVKNFRSHLKSKLSSVEHYGKFDDQYKKLLADLSSVDATAGIRLIELFIRDHLPEDYSQRKNEIADCQRRLREIENELRDNTLNLLQNPQNADNDLLDWEAKITRVERRIGICEKTLEQLSTHSPYRQEFIQQIDSLRGEIQNIKSYSPYYQAYSGVESTSDLYKVGAISDFVQKYRGQYPSPLPRYTLERLEKQKVELVTRFEQELRESLDSAPDSLELPWEARLQRAKSRLDALRFYVKATGADKRVDINKAEDLISQAVRNIEFEKSAYEITHFHGDERRFFTIIRRFYSEFPAWEWEKLRPEDYERIRGLEAEKITALKSAYEQEISAYQNADSLHGIENNLKAQVEICGKYQGKLHSAFPEYEKLGARIYELTNQIAVIRGAKAYAKRIALLLTEEKTITKEKKDLIAAFLTGVTSLVREVGGKQVHPFVQNKYSELLALRDKWNGELYHSMREELKPWEFDLEGQALTDEEKSDINEKILIIRKKYLALFSPESRCYDLAKREYENGVRSQERAKKERMVKERWEELESVLKDDRNGVDMKLGEINQFLTLVKSLGGVDEFPSFRYEFEFVRNTEQNLTWMHRLAELKSEIDRFIGNPPSQDDESRILEFIPKCEEFKSKLTHFKNHTLTAKDAEALDKIVTENHAKYQEYALGWKLYRVVKEESEKFLDNPNDSSYKNFTAAVNEYKILPIKNSKHNDDVKSLAEKNKKINDSRMVLEEMFYAFRQNGRPYDLDNLISAAEKYQADGRKENPTTRYAKEVKKEWRNVTVELVCYDFRGSGFESGWGFDVDFFAIIGGFYNPASVVFDIPDISGDGKNNPGQERLKQKSQKPLAESALVSRTSKVTIEFGNKNWSNDLGTASVEFAYILSRGMDYGVYTHTFFARSKRRPNLPSGWVEIRFSGLPRLIK